MKQNKVKRLKKGQALIQSKIASPSVGIPNNQGFSAGHQADKKQPQLNLTHQHERIKAQTQLHSSQENAGLHNQTNRSSALSKRMMSLHSERTSVDRPVQKQSVRDGSTKHSNDTKMVISSSGVHLEKVDDQKLGIAGQLSRQQIQTVARDSDINSYDMAVEREVQSTDRISARREASRPQSKLQKERPDGQEKGLKLTRHRESTKFSQDHGDFAAYLSPLKQQVKAGATKSKGMKKKETQFDQKQLSPSKQTSAPLNQKEKNQSATIPTQMSQKSGPNRDQASSTSIKAALKPLILHRVNNNTSIDNPAHHDSSLQSTEQPGLNSSAGGNGQVHAQRQVKNIRNSFNNFFVTSKQPAAAAEHQIKFRMSSVEHRNELKNYLELASLAQDQMLDLNEPSVFKGEKANSNFVSVKGNTLYKRANPMVTSESAGSAQGVHAVQIDQRIAMSNGFEKVASSHARREANNNSQLQSLSNTNAQLMPALHHGNMVPGVRNQNNRTTLGHHQNHNPPQLAPHQKISKLAAKDSLSKGASGAAYQNKLKREKPYQSETYRLNGAHHSHTSQHIQPSGPSQKQLTSVNGPANSKFVANRNSPGHISHNQKHAQPLAAASIGTEQMSGSPLVGSSSVFPSSTVSMNNDNYSQHHYQLGVATAGSSIHKLQAKFINTKQSGAFSAVSNALKTNGGKPLPVRARTNLDKYEESSQSALLVYNQQPGQNGTSTTTNLNEHLQGGRAKIAATSSVTTIPTTHDEAAYRGVTIQGASTSYAAGISETTAQTALQTPDTGTLSARKISSQVLKSSKKSTSSKPHQITRQQVSQVSIGASRQVVAGASPSAHQSQLHNSSATIDRLEHAANTGESAGAQSALSKKKYQLNQSKMVLEPLSMSNSINLPNPDSSAVSTQKRKQRSLIKPINGPVKSGHQTSSKFQEGVQVNSNGGDKNYIMISASGQGSINKGQGSNSISVGSQNATVTSKFSNQGSKGTVILNQARTGATSGQGESDLSRRASHQPVSIMQNRISSQMAYRCQSRQKSRGPSAMNRREGSAQNNGRSLVGSRQRTGLSSQGRALAGEGDLGPLPRALAAKQLQLETSTDQNAKIMVQQHPSDKSLLRHSNYNNFPKPGNQQKFSNQNPSKGEVEETLDHATETERQLIIARGGSLSRKVNHLQEDEDDIFNDQTGFRIKINKEQKVVNHLEDRVENNNLLFYNFNAYRQESGGDSSQNAFSNSNNRQAYGAEEPSQNYQANQSRQAVVNRPFSRSSKQSVSRQDYRQRQIYTAASTTSIKSRRNLSKQNQRQVKDGRPSDVPRQTDGASVQESHEEQVHRNISSTSLLVDQAQVSGTQGHAEHHRQFANAALSVSYDLMNSNSRSLADVDSDGVKMTSGASSNVKQSLNKKNLEQLSEAIANNSVSSTTMNLRAAAGASVQGQNRYKQSNSNNMAPIDQQPQMEAVNRRSEQHSMMALIPNVTSSGSLTTAATTKGSDFGAGHHSNMGASGVAGSGPGGSSTPKRGSINILNEVVVPRRPTNTSRVLNEHGQTSSTRKHRSGHRMIVGLNESGENQQKILIPSQYSIMKASQTSIGQNSFARSAMRLKQKSSRNGVPNRGGSLDGVSSQATSGEDRGANAPGKASDGLISRAGRTAGGAVWSRMLNMQSVEEGIQEGNISSEDD